MGFGLLHPLLCALGPCLWTRVHKGWSIPFLHVAQLPSLSCLGPEPPADASVVPASVAALGHACITTWHCWCHLIQTGTAQCSHESMELVLTICSIALHQVLQPAGTVA